jgi:membrane peptidoglycan carboxypeptidase
MFERFEWASAFRVSHIHRNAAIVAAAVFSAGLVALDLQSSWAESRILPIIDRRATFSIKPGASRQQDRPTKTGPYDERLGYSQNLELIGKLQKAGFQIEAQASDSPTSRFLTRMGLDPVYREKDQAGLLLLDHTGQPFYESQYPRRVYPDFASIPPLVVQTLLFIENREMLDASYPDRNPAIQWGRFTQAMLDAALHAVDRSHSRAGGSTLATQLEKMRHSPAGRTDSVIEKARQMVSASLQAYREGPNTLRRQREIVVDYINSIPLSATRADGEVIGLADGLHDWYGEDTDQVNGLLSASEGDLSQHDLERRATAYREVLSLLLALRAPTRYLAQQPDALAEKTDSYLRALSVKGVISPRLRDDALKARSVPRTPSAPEAPATFVADKASLGIRASLLPLLGVQSSYALDRLDMNVQTTLDNTAQTSVTRFLNGLSSPQAVKAAGLDQYQLLDRGKADAVIYSVTLYERRGNSNLLRIQTDNFNEPLDINRGTRLQLGSTAKLRTMINYLQVVEDLHRQYADSTSAQLKEIAVRRGDNITRWAIDYLAQSNDRSLEPMLKAALQRRYSGSNGEAFFTAGGLHHFDNFEREEDYQIMPVSEAFQRSVNLVFIRLMRDLERYYMYRLPGVSPHILDDPEDPARQQYLNRFADFEGSTFERRFYEKYNGQSPDQSLEKLLSGIRLTPVRAAVIFRSIRPQADADQFAAFLRAHLPEPVLARVNIGRLFDKYGPDKFDLRDRGYLAHVHPLELWLLQYREEHPGASLDDMLAASARERVEVYRWLFRTRYRRGQNTRIATLLEIDAFQQIQHAWKSLGYPFDSLVPSYATSIGVSGDTPQALAELAGIILNNGVRYPARTIDQLQLAKDTPWETVLSRPAAEGVHVLSPVIARLVRQEMLGVVENGTGRRAHGGFPLPDGKLLPIGGKTGTGDNRLQRFAANGGLIGSQVQNRTAAFVFFIGDRFYGTVLAFVPGKSAGNYGFTSALAVQVLKDLEPSLLPLVTQAGS